MYYIVNKEKDGDNFYNIHKITCTHKPKKNFVLCDGTLQGAARLLGVPIIKVKKCKFCE